MTGMKMDPPVKPEDDRIWGLKMRIPMGFHGL